MRRLWITFFVLAVLGGGAMILLARATRPEWTTESPEALEAFEQGLEAQNKLYHSDAVAHYRRAVQLDPGFTMAKLVLCSTLEDRERRDQLERELRETDPSPLTEREQFLLSYHLARYAEEVDKAEQILGEYLESHPDDPFALYARSSEAWAKQDWEEAELYSMKLLATDPNWVTAQNRLGYTSMAQGHFAEAEDRFKTYKFIAPDQANPYDSLGELLVLLGRYEEAEAELEGALGIRPDFCASYGNLVSLAILRGRPDDAEPILERVRENCGEGQVAQQRCSVAVWRELLAGDLEAAWQAGQEACVDIGKRASIELVRHRLALATGRREEALALEEKVRGRLEEGSWEGGYAMDGGKGLLRHMEGVRRAADGEYAEAEELLLEADGNLAYWGSQQGFLKLHNLLSLAWLYERMGDRLAAETVFERVWAVNPEFVRRFSKIAALN